MKGHRFSLILTLAALCVGGSDAFAQRIDSPYRFLEHSQYLGVYAGYVWAQEGQLQMGPQPAPTFGARWAIRVGGPFSIGADVGVTPTTRTVRDTTLILPDSTYRAVGESDVLLVSIMGEGRFSLTGARTWYRLQPFLSAGAGVVFDAAGTPAVEQDMPPSERFNFGTSFAGHLGAGVEWFATNRVSVRVDGRGLFWRLGAPEALTQRRAIPRSEWENNAVVTAGLSYHF